MTAFWNKNKKTGVANIPQKKAVKELAMPEAVSAVSDKTGKASNILVRPILTEKGTMLENQGQYLFQVKVGATKPEVRKAVKQLYGVTPIKVNMIKMEGKNVRFGRFEGVQKNWKKAIVLLKKGEKIEMYNK